MTTAAIAWRQESPRPKTHAYSTGLALMALAGLLVVVRDVTWLIPLIPEGEALHLFLIHPYVSLLPLFLIAAAGICLRLAPHDTEDVVHSARYATRRQLDVFSPRKAATAGAFTFSMRPGLVWSEASAEEEVIVKGIVIRARNDGSVPVQLTRATLVSDKTAERLPMYAMLPDGVAALDDLDPIPPGAEVLLESCLPDLGLEKVQFRRQFGEFSFAVDYDGETHRHQFERDFVDESLRSTRPRPAHLGVTRKRPVKLQETAQPRRPVTPTPA